jgi:hypothetical protein
MRKSLQTLVLVTAAACAISGCANTYDPGQRALGGAAMGAGAGALIGGVAGGGNGALTGALLGGAVGAVGGLATTPERPQQNYEQPQSQYRY